MPCPFQILAGALGIKTKYLTLNCLAYDWTIIYALPLEISRRESWNPRNQFNAATFLCLENTHKDKTVCQYPYQYDLILIREFCWLIRLGLWCLTPLSTWEIRTLMNPVVPCLLMSQYWEHVWNLHRLDDIWNQI